MSNAVARILIIGILFTHLFNPFFVYYWLKGIILSLYKSLRKRLLKETSSIEYKKYFYCGISDIKMFIYMQIKYFLLGMFFAIFYGIFFPNLAQSKPFLPIILYAINLLFSENYFSILYVEKYKILSCIYYLCVFYPLAVLL